MANATHTHEDVRKLANNLLPTWDRFVTQIFEYAHRHEIADELMEDALRHGYGDDIADAYTEALEEN